MRVVHGLAVLLSIAFSSQARGEPPNPNCLAGDPFSCLEGEPSLSAATRACDLGQPVGCRIAGAQWINAKPDKPALALRLFDKACEQGDSIGCYQSGQLLSDEGSAIGDVPRAFVVLYRSCRQGYGPACTLVGALHADGVGHPKDFTRAAIAYRNGCERRDPRGCILLGRLLVRPADAAAAYHQACQLENAEGCVQLELMKKKGIVPSATLTPLLDPMVEAERASRNKPGGRNALPFTEVRDCAQRTLEPACVRGDLAVCQQSADLQQNGGDGAAAYCMRRQACERGDGFACEQLGLASEAGQLPSSLEVAQGWYEKGCLGGSAPSCASAVRLIDKVDPWATANQRATRKLALTLRGCALDSAGDCLVVYQRLLTKIPDPVLAHRAWITLGRWCEKDPREGPACAVVEDRRKALVLERDCHAGKAVACREAAPLNPDPSRASALLGQACALGDCQSCLGRKAGEAVPVAEVLANQRKAAEVCPAECRAAAVQDIEPKACGYAVRALAQLGGPKNERRAIGFAEEQCKRGFTCELLAELFVVTETLAADDEKRVGALLDRACANHRAGTCQAHAELALIRPARALCRRGEVEGCLKLADQLKLSAVEFPQVSVAWERACKLGSNLGCVRHWASLGSALSRDSTAVEESHRKAADACQAGELQICIELANHLKFRSSDPQALAELKEVAERAVTALRIQCDRADSDACETAFNFLQFKKELDGPTRAKEFLRKACEHGAGTRCVELAEQCVRSKDPTGAAQYEVKACTHGSSAGCRMLLEQRNTLASDLREEADRALGAACGKGALDACELAADAGIAQRPPVSAAPPGPLSAN